MIIVVDQNSEETTLPKHLLLDYRANRSAISIIVTNQNSIKTDNGFVIFRLDDHPFTIDSPSGFVVPNSAIKKTIGQWR